MALDWNNLTDIQFLNLYGYVRNPPAPKPFCQWVQPLNSFGLASYVQARNLRGVINSALFLFVDGQRAMGGGVLDGDDESKTDLPTGIFIETWTYVGTPSGAQSGPDGTSIPFWRLNFRFKNGAVMNVGEIFDALSRYPRAQSYAVSHLAADVEQNAV